MSNSDPLIGGGVATDGLPAQSSGAKALLLTILGEFVLPAGGAAWTSTLVAAADTLNIGEKNARQALARIGDQGLLERSRHGRSVRWSLTAEGHKLLESGTRRIYEFGTSRVEWDGEWLLAHCPVAESQRTLRTDMRKRLGFLGFGELSASLLVSPHSEREPELRRVLGDLGVVEHSTILRSTTSGRAENVALVQRAWDLQGLGQAYGTFSEAKSAVTAYEGADQFRAIVELVHDWRRFPFADPELPTELLPQGWAGISATSLFHDRHKAWSPAAQEWFRELDESNS